MHIILSACHILVLLGSDSSEVPPHATESGEDGQLSGGAVAGGSADVAGNDAEGDREASGGSQLSAGSVPSDMSADLGGDAVAQVSGALGVAARGRAGPVGDLDAAACSMDERRTVRQLRRSAPLTKA